MRVGTRVRVLEGAGVRVGARVRVRGCWGEGVEVRVLG